MFPTVRSCIHLTHDNSFCPQGLYFINASNQKWYKVALQPCSFYKTVLDLSLWVDVAFGTIKCGRRVFR